MHISEKNKMKLKDKLQKLMKSKQKYKICNPNLEKQWKS